MIDLPQSPPISKNEPGGRPTASRICAHLVDPARIARHDRERASRRGGPGRRSASARGGSSSTLVGQVREEPPRPREGLVLASRPRRRSRRWRCGCRRDRAPPWPRRRAHAHSTSAGPAIIIWAVSAHDHRVVRRGDAGGADAGHRAQRERHRRRHRQVVDHDVPAPHLGDVGAAAVSIVLTEPPPPMPSTRRTWGSWSSSARDSAGVALLGNGGVGRAAAHGEVVARDHDAGRPSISPVPNTKFDGVKSTRLPSLVVARRRRRSCRSRGRCRGRRRGRSARARSACRSGAGASTLSAPPICLGSSSRRRSSSISGSQLTPTSCAPTF